MENIIVECLPTLLTEAITGQSQDQHSAAVQKLKELAPTQPHLVFELLKEYYHVRVQEGHNIGEFDRIFYDEHGQPIFDERQLLNLMEGLTSKGDNSHRELIKRAKQFTEQDKRKYYRILVIGSGSGRLARELAYELGHNVHVIESDISVRDITRNYLENVGRGLDGKITSIPADAANLRTWVDGSIDIVISFGALRYFGPKKSRLATSEIARVLRDDGLVLIGESSQRRTWPYLISNFQRMLGEHLFVHLDRYHDRVFRNTTLYNLLFQYRYNQDRDYNRIFRTVVDSIMAGKD